MAVREPLGPSGFLRNAGISISSIPLLVQASALVTLLRMGSLSVPLSGQHGEQSPRYR
jgi:hypothetical protein